MAYRPIKMPSQSAPDLLKYEISNFLGIDKRNKPANVETYRTPAEGPAEKNVFPNLIRDGDKKVSKDLGWEVLHTYTGRFNGRHYLKSQDKELYHIGTQYFLSDDMENALWTGKDEISVSVEYGGKLWIFDGMRYIVFGKFDNTWQIKAVDTIAYVPTLIIQRAPTGGGTVFEPVNLLSGRYKCEFVGDETSTAYTLLYPNIPAGNITVQVSNASGGKDTLTENTDYTINRETGILTFTQPHPPVVAQRGNIFVEAPATFEGYTDKINHAMTSVQYDVGASTSRLVCTQTTDNLSFYSEFEDYTYFPDTYYIEAGQDSSPTMCYSIQGMNLLVHKKSDADNRNTWAFRAEWDGESVTFRLYGQYQGAGAAGRYTVAYGGSEPMFFTGENVHAITATDVLGEQMSQSRSDYITPMLQKESGHAVAISYDGFYKLFIGGHVYSLDTTQASYGSLPFYHRQYECYARDNVPARFVWEKDGRLYFGTDDGRVCAFFTDREAELSFADNGESVHAKWYTSEFYGTRADLWKTFQRIYVLLGAYSHTGIRITAFFDGETELIRDYDDQFSYFVYSKLIYSRMTYKGDVTPQSAIEKLKIKKVGKIQFLLENSRTEPFTLYSVIAEYFQSR